MPSIEEMQRSRETREDWIAYAAFDAEGTWLLHEQLAERLSRLEWRGGKSLLDFYRMYMVDFGKCLTDMERRGVRVNVDHLAGIEVRAKADQVRHIKVFREVRSEEERKTRATTATQTPPIFSLMPQTTIPLLRTRFALRVRLPRRSGPRR